ncbi:MAG: tetratricopeptide repeat protein [Thermoplasmatales archaeon]|nr:tetratricopeptide repeat protein [Thermoplasmatales archaeon]
MILLRKYDEAEKEYREAIRINPNDAEAYANLGILYIEVGKKKDATKY